MANDRNSRTTHPRKRARRVRAREIILARIAWWEKGPDKFKGSEHVGVPVNAEKRLAKAREELSNLDANLANHRY